MNISLIMQNCQARPVIGRNVPDDLKPFTCYVPDGGYCVICVPEIFSADGEKEPEMWCIPLPEKYVLETGYRFLGNGIPCVRVEYDKRFGAIVDEKYDTWR